MNQPTLPKPLAKYVNQTPALRLVILLAGLAIIVAAMKVAASFLVPILLAVLFVVVFWGWILGPIGLILSIPITVALKIFLESYDGTRWLATMLGERET